MLRAGRGVQAAGRLVGQDDRRARRPAPGRWRRAGTRRRTARRDGARPGWTGRPRPARRRRPGGAAPRGRPRYSSPVATLSSAVRRGDQEELLEHEADPAGADRRRAPGRAGRRPTCPATRTLPEVGRSSVPAMASRSTCPTRTARRSRRTRPSRSSAVTDRSAVTGGEPGCSLDTPIQLAARSLGHHHPGPGRDARPADLDLRRGEQARCARRPGGAPRTARPPRARSRRRPARAGPRPARPARRGRTGPPATPGPGRSPRCRCAPPRASRRGAGRGPWPDDRGDAVPGHGAGLRRQARLETLLADGVIGGRRRVQRHGHRPLARRHLVRALARRGGLARRDVQRADQDRGRAGRPPARAGSCPVTVRPRAACQRSTASAVARS